MDFQRNKVAAALGYLLGAGSAASLIALPAQAADIRVDVTGSNIKRVEGEGALPVQTLTREDIESTGVQTTKALIDSISANQSFGSYNTALGEGFERGGLQRRFAARPGNEPNPGADQRQARRSVRTRHQQQLLGCRPQPDPVSAIERVEILKDGASAMYGTTQSPG